MRGLPRRLLETFDDRTVGPLMAALQRAYDSAAELHDPSRGSNTRTFGYTLYHFSVHELVAASADLSHVKVRSRDPLFRLQVRDYELACHRVGQTASDNIMTSFPGNDGAAPRMVEEQLWLPNVPRRQGVGDARKLVLAHLGNIEDGFEAAYLCAPSRTDGGSDQRMGVRSLAVEEGFSDRQFRRRLRRAGTRRDGGGTKAAPPHEAAHRRRGREWKGLVIRPLL